MSAIHRLALVAGAASLLTTSATAAAAQSRTRTEPVTRIDTTVRVGRDATIDLGLTSGDITVRPSSGDEVRIVAVSEYIPLRFEHVGNTVRISTVSGTYRRSGDQRIDISVPVGSRVRAASVSGDVEVRGIRGEVDASAVSGDVTVENAVRRANANTVSGDVRVRNVDGDLRVRSVSGDVVVERVTGEVNAESTSGEIEIYDARSSRVHAESISGEITYEGTIARDGRYDFSSHSGNVKLGIPRDAALSLSASTFSGTVNSSLPATLAPNSLDRTTTRGRTRRRMELAINGGGARVIAETFSGNINITGPSRSSSRNDQE